MARHANAGVCSARRGTLYGDVRKVNPGFHEGIFYTSAPSDSCHRPSCSVEVAHMADLYGYRYTVWRSTTAEFCREGRSDCYREGRSGGEDIVERSLDLS